MKPIEIPFQVTVTERYSYESKRHMLHVKCETINTNQVPPTKEAIK